LVVLWRLLDAADVTATLIATAAHACHRTAAAAGAAALHGVVSGSAIGDVGASAPLSAVVCLSRVHLVVSARAGIESCAHPTFVHFRDPVVIVLCPDSKNLVAIIAGLSHRVLCSEDFIIIFGGRRLGDATDVAVALIATAAHTCHRTTAAAGAAALHGVVSRRAISHVGASAPLSTEY
jgi:hypothetical protein